MKTTKLYALLLVLFLSVSSLTGCFFDRTGPDVGENTPTEDMGKTEISVDHDKSRDVETPSKKLETINVTFVSSPLNIPSITEQTYGLFQKVFEEIGVKNVNYWDLTSGADQTQALASGDVDFLYCVGATSVLLSAANGADIKIISMYSRSPKAFCLFSADDSISSPEDLRGKTIVGPQGTILHELLVAYLATADMSISDVDFVNTSIPNALAALSGGSADCALLAGAAAYNAHQNNTHLVTDGAGLVEASICCATTQKMIDTSPNVVSTFLKAQQTVLDYIDTNPDDAIEATADFLGLDRYAVEEMAEYYDFSMEIQDSDIKAIENTAAFLLDSGMIEEPINVPSLIVR